MCLASKDIAEALVVKIEYCWGKSEFHYVRSDFINGNLSNFD
jgi:hypothetical protein